MYGPPTLATCCQYDANEVYAVSTAAAASTHHAVHPADRLLDALARSGSPVCVGLDPVVDRLPLATLSSDGSKTDAVRRFCLGVLDAIEPHVSCVKIQSACFERFGWPGVAVLHDVAAGVRAKKMTLILDAKRGDIGISAEHYAVASGEIGADWTTANGYLGADGLLPFLEPFEGVRRGAFALVRTSNPSSDAFQSLPLADGRTVAEAMADLVASVGAKHRGVSGYSSLGAVVGATKPGDAAVLRARMPHQILLVPGFGAQGGSVDDVLPCFRPDGTGAIVTASRSVLYPADASAATGGDWKSPIARAAESFAREIRNALGQS